MREWIRLTSETLPWFRPLLGEQWCKRIEQQQNVYAIGAVEDKTACGVLVFCVRELITEIQMLAVAPAYRRRGIARGMVEYLCRHAWETITPVVCSFAAPNRQDPVYLFFAELEHFSVAPEEGMICQVPLAGLAENRRLMAPRGKGGLIQPFFSLPVAMRRHFFRRLEQQGALLWDDFDGVSCRQDLSFCVMSGNEILAAMFMSEDGADLELSFVWCAPNAHLQLMELLAQAAVRLPQRAGKLRIAAVTPVSVSIVDKLLPEREVIAQFYQAAWDMER